MNATRRTLGATIVVALLAASNAWALEGRQTFDITVTPGQQISKSNCDVVNGAGWVNYELQPADKIDEDSVVWTGPPGLLFTEKTVWTQCVIFGGESYTITARGRFKSAQPGEPADAFEATFTGKVYEPFVRFIKPDADKYTPRGRSKDFEIQLEIKAKLGATEVEITNHDLYYQLEIVPDDAAKASFEGTGVTKVLFMVPDGGQATETLRITDQALAGDEFHTTAFVTNRAEYEGTSVTSKKITIYGITIDSVSPEWVGLENPARGNPWTGTLANEVTFNLKILPSTYTDASGGKVEVYDPTGDPTKTTKLDVTFSGETGTAKLPKGESVQVSQYKAKAFLHYDDDEKKTSSEQKTFDTFAVDISNPSNSKLITEKHSAIDFTAVQKPSGSPAGTLSWEGGSSVGNFASDDWTTVFNTSNLGVANVWVEYAIGSSTAKSNKVEITVAEVDLDIYPGGSDLDIGEENRALPGSPVADSIEESEGAYLLVNWDDDDNDGGANGTPVPDLSEQSSPVTITGEDNLARIDLKLDPNPTAGTVSLSFPSGSSKIVVWTDATKGTKVTDLEWNIDNGETVPSTLWLEGVAASSSQRDVTAALSWSKGTSSVSDTVKATVVMIRLGNAVYREMAGPPQAAGHSGVIRKFLGTCVTPHLELDNGGI